MVRYFSLTFSSLCGCISLLPAGASPIPLQALPTLPVGKYEPAMDRWQQLLRATSNETFGIYSVQSGAKLGWLETSRVVVKSGGSQILRTREVAHYSYLLEGKLVRHEVALSHDFDIASPHTLRSALHDETRGKSRRTVVLSRTGKGEYLAEITEGGQTRRREMSNLEFTAVDLLGPRLWSMDGTRQRGDCRSFRGLDVKSLEPFVQKACVLQPMHENAAQLSVSDLAHDFSSVLTFNGTGGLLGSIIAGRSELRPETMEQAKSDSKQPDLVGESLVSCDRPLGANFGKSASFKFSIHGPELAGIPATASQRVSSQSAAGVVEVTTGQGFEVPATAAEMKVNLKSTALVPLEIPELQALAKQAIGDARTPETKVKALVEFVSKFVKNDPAPAPLGLMEIVQKRTGDCTSHALLFTALARINGIPCREATGYIYLGDQKQAFGGHAWNEVVLDGNWHPVDPTWQEFQLNPTHIQLSSGTPGLRDARFFNGNIKIEVL
jgi:hypothetical protein